MKDILLYGPIDPGASRKFLGELEAALRGRGDITLRINCPGGDVAEGIAIFNAIRRVSDRVVCVIEGVAYSMASVIAMAGRETHAFELAQLMIHEPSMAASGGTRDLEAALGALQAARATLVSAYTAKSGQSEADVLAAMASTTFFSATQAKEFGLVDTILGDRALPMAAFDPMAWAEYHAGRGPMPVTMVAQGAAATVAELREACDGATDTFIVKAIESGWTVAQATTEHTKQLASALVAVTAERDALRAQAKAPAPVKLPGVQPLGMGYAPRAASDSPKAAWLDAIKERVDKGMTRTQAVSDIARKDPELREQYLAYCNE